MCVESARWVQQEILEKNPAAKIRVYAVWLSMVASDARSKWKDTVMTDPRVTHLWDEGQLVGRWFAQHADPPYKGEIAWDAYFLYDCPARWDAAPAPLISWGRTIVRTREKLQADVLPRLKN